MPWFIPSLVRRGTPYLLLVLVMGMVVSCVTVASTPTAMTPSTAEPIAISEALVPGATSTPAATESPSPPPRNEPPRNEPPSAVPTPAPSPTVVPTPRLPAGVLEVPATAAPVTTPAPSPTSGTAALTVPSPKPDGTLAGTLLDRKTVAKLQRILDNQVANKDVAGLQAAVRLPSGQTWIGVAGQAEFDPDRPIEADTQFAIASVTKTFTAALILQLAEEGKIDLDAPFGTYFRDAPRKDKATVRQLLSHTSGIYNFWSGKRYAAISRAWWETPGADGLKARDHRWTYDEMIDLVKNGSFKPGQGYEYSNTNYLILGQVAEAVGGEPIARQLRERFFEPLGLADTVYQPAQKPRADAAHGHWAWPGGHTDHTKDSPYVPFMAAASIADAAGAMASTAGDLATWAAALYGGDVLSDAMRAQMTDFLRPGWYGLGADVGLFAGHRGHGHRGGIRGYESSMWYFPDSGVSVVLLSNQGNWLTDPVVEKMVKAVLGEA